MTPGDFPADVGLIVMSDDPADGPSVGPPGDGKLQIRPGLGIWVAVVWSGAWDDGIWEKISAAARRPGASLLLVLTQTPHHAAWVEAVRPLGVPILEIAP